MTDANGSVRLNKRLAELGITTRRAADDLIASGKVLVNGKKAVIGMKVGPHHVIEVSKNNSSVQRRLYVAYNKPRGIITHSPQEGEADITSMLPPVLRGNGLFPVGRLDKDSFGLILLTNDGRITDRLLHPNAVHEKEYAVRTKMPLRASFKERMEQGVDIEGYMTKPAKVRITGERSFTIILTEGKKHQIRRMVAALHNEVAELRRTRILNVRLGELKAGEARYIEGAELKAFLTTLKLKN